MTEENTPAEPGAKPVMTEKDENLFSCLSHLSYLTIFLGIPGIIGTLVIWLWKREESAKIDENGKEALNFQISILIYTAACGVMFLLVFPLFLIPVIGFVGLIFSILAAVEVNQGKTYRYPLTIRLIK